MRLRMTCVCLMEESTGHRQIVRALRGTGLMFISRSCLLSTISVIHTAIVRQTHRKIGAEATFRDHPTPLLQQVHWSHPGTLWVSPEKQTPLSLWAACSTALPPSKRFFLLVSGTSCIQFVSSAVCPGAGHHWKKESGIISWQPPLRCLYVLVSHLFSKLNRHRFLSLSSQEMLQVPSLASLPSTGPFQ